jgi:predicted alpha-1,2-mannosidase
MPLAALAALTALATPAAAQGRSEPDARPRQPVDWVDPMIGTGTSRWLLFPGPTMPFGMVKLSPDNQGQGPAPAKRHWKAGYEYTIDNIMGFSHIHSWTMSGLMTVPTTGPLKVTPGPEDAPDAGYRSRIDHDTERASPGYYAVTLEDYDIRAELTTTTRAGLQRYTFPASDSARILFDQVTPSEYGAVLEEAVVRRVSDRRIAGYAKLRRPEFQRYTLHFVARVNKPFQSMGGWVKDRIKRDVQKIEGAGDVGAFLTFDTEPDEQILLKTGISLVSIEQARLNLEKEMGPFGWDFDAVRQSARDTWNALLGRIRIEGGTATNRTKFYTNMYRAYAGRTIWSDVNGKYVDMHERVQQLPDPASPVYGSDAFWNTFWNLNQLWRLASPKITSRWVRSLLEIHDKGGWLPKGPTGIEYSSIMVAEHAIPFIVGAYQHGIRDFDVDKALEAMVHVQTTMPRAHPGGGRVGNQDLKAYLEHHYVPAGEGASSNTLEYAYDDWCVAQMAKARGRAALARRFTERAGYWRNLFNKESGFMQPRKADGAWLEDFDPYSFRGGWVEANPWQYTWFVPQDVPGLVEAMGRERFIDRLSKGMTLSARHDFNAPGDDFQQVPINHGNQPSMQAAYLFNYAGEPWRTQKWARAIMDQYYGDGPRDGWPGDEDQGQGGAWFVMSAIGLFQTDGGARIDPIYEIGSPLFDRVVIQLDPDYYKGDTFTIEARNQAPDHPYIQSATLDGQPLNKPWFRADRLHDGGKLILEMGPTPNKQWGAGLDNAPPAAR